MHDWCQQELACVCVYTALSARTLAETRRRCACACGKGTAEECTCPNSTSSVRLSGSGPPQISPPGCEIAPSREDDINMYPPPLILEVFQRVAASLERQAQPW